MTLNITKPGDSKNCQNTPTFAFHKLDRTARKLCSLLCFWEESISLRLKSRPANRTVEPSVSIFTIDVKLLAPFWSARCRSYKRWSLDSTDPLLAMTNTFKLIWAVRDMTGLLALIAKSDHLPLMDVSHAKRFIEAFQTSFLGGHSVLLDLWWWLQGLPNWPDKNFMAHYWDDRHCNNADDDDDPPFMDAPLIA
ncbi:hypothetical protein IW262DRAFT_1299416 [Armillaria fumosa]|nr:hypothetical protein IW262DRAFT_1299416 [Armillaria fumosa]